MKQLLVTVYNGGFSINEINLTVPSGMYVQLSDHRTDRAIPSKLELTLLCADSNDSEELVRVVRQAQAEAVAEGNLKDAPRGEAWEPEPEIMAVLGLVGMRK